MERIIKKLHKTNVSSVHINYKGLKNHAWASIVSLPQRNS